MEKVGKLAIFRMISFIFADFTLWLSGASRIAPRGAIREAKDQVWALRGQYARGAIREALQYITSYTTCYTFL